MEKNKVAVIGAGLMGNGIAQACATAGYDVVNIDTFEAAIEKSKATVEKLFSRKVAKGSMTEEKKAEILGRLTYSQNFEDVKGAFLVVEAVPEKIEIKKDTFKKVDELADAETIIVSNTSGLSISEIASVTNRPDKVMGAHFFYPAPVMKLLELVRGLVTSDETYDVVKEFAGKIGKTTVDAPEFPGFACFTFVYRSTLLSSACAACPTCPSSASQESPIPCARLAICCVLLTFSSNS